MCKPTNIRLVDNWRGRALKWAKFFRNINPLQPRFLASSLFIQCLSNHFTKATSVTEKWQPFNAHLMVHYHLGFYKRPALGTWWHQQVRMDFRFALRPESMKTWEFRLVNEFIFAYLSPQLVQKSNNARVSYSVFCLDNLLILCL